MNAPLPLRVLAKWRDRINHNTVAIRVVPRDTRAPLKQTSWQKLFSRPALTGVPSCS